MWGNDDPATQQHMGCLTVGLKGAKRGENGERQAFVLFYARWFRGMRWK